MSDRCLVCGGVIGMLADCIECGTCAICYPFRCTCVYEYEPDWEDLEEIWWYEDDELGEILFGEGEEESAGFPYDIVNPGDIYGGVE